MEWQPPIDVDTLSKGMYSQGAEEGILDQIFARVPPRRQFCVDLGASDGLRNSNTARFVRDAGWSGVFVEGSDYRFGKLADNYRDIARARLVHATVQPDTVEQLFAEADVPADLDLLSIDIDGNDYWVWRAIERYRPQVLVIEYNPYYAPPERWVMTFNRTHAWDGSTYYGASLESLYHLGKQKGYELVCCDKNGNNAFFVEQSLYARFELPTNAPQALFRPAMYKVRYIGKNTFVTGHPYRYGPGEEL